MKANFKPLGVAAAVAAVTAGYAGAVNAQATTSSYASATELGDLAIVPYYTVMDGYATGVNIINTADRTQVIKFRFRRATDSMDAMDFNVVLSPKDMYTGFIGMEGDDIVWTSNDNSCTAPALDGNKFTMPGLYRAGAETGYIEVISMGSPEVSTTVDGRGNVVSVDDSPISKAAKHGADGVPASCDLVRDNFFRNDGDPTKRGVIKSDQTHQYSGANGAAEPTFYEASPDSLKVSYFIKSDETGVEFGDNAVHVAGFIGSPSMTNQQTGIFNGDLQGFDYPDLNGGSPLDISTIMVNSRGKFNELRSVLGASELINDWSANTAGTFSVDTDWVVTFPGQYVMLNLPTYLQSLVPGSTTTCTRYDALTPGTCDYRDIPVKATITVYDREEQGITVEEGDLVVSPQPPVFVDDLLLKDEVNVIEWGNAPVLNAPTVISGLAVPQDAKFGWASLVGTAAGTAPQLCDWALAPPPAAAEYLCVTPASGTAPVVGFVAWQRNFADLPAANYGRIVAHSRTQS